MINKIHTIKPILLRRGTEINDAKKGPLFKQKINIGLASFFKNVTNLEFFLMDFYNDGG